MGQESCCGLTGSFASGSPTRPQSRCYPGLWSAQGFWREFAFTYVVWAGFSSPWTMGLMPQSLTSYLSEVYPNLLPREQITGKTARESMLQDGSHSLLWLITEVTAHHDCHILFVRMMSPVHTQGQGITGTQDIKTRRWGSLGAVWEGCPPPSFTCIVSRYPDNSSPRQC